jgi:hypothetical protein
MRNLYSSYQEFLFLNIWQFFFLRIIENRRLHAIILITNFHSPTPSQSFPSSTMFPYQNRKQNLKIKKRKASKWEYTHTHTEKEIHWERDREKYRESEKMREAKTNIIYLYLSLHIIIIHMTSALILNPSGPGLWLYFEQFKQRHET